MAYTSSSGPVMTKFTIALREIGTYKEVLRSQVDIHICIYCAYILSFNFNFRWYNFGHIGMVGWEYAEWQVAAVCGHWFAWCEGTDMIFWHLIYKFHIGFVPVIKFDNICLGCPKAFWQG